MLPTHFAFLVSLFLPFLSLAQNITSTNLLQGQCDFGPSIGVLLIKEVIEVGTSGITAKRAVKVSGSLKGLCNRAPYAFTVNEFNNPECACTEVGGELFTIDESLLTAKSGTLTVATDPIPFSLVKTNVNPTSLLGGSCVLRVPHSALSRCHSCPKVICAPIRLLPVCQINSL